LPDVSDIAAFYVDAGFAPVTSYITRRGYHQLTILAGRWPASFRDRVKLLFTRRRSRLDVRHKSFLRMTRRPLRLVLSQRTFLKGTPRHHPFDDFGRPRLPSELPTCTQDLTPSNTALRSLTGLGCFTCSTTNRLIGPEFNRPTVFAGRPLLTGNNQRHYG